MNYDNRLWHAVEVGCDEWFLGKPDSDDPDHGWSPFIDLGDVDRELAERIVACMNFCRQFPTEFLQYRVLVKLTGQENGELRGSLGDIPGLDGLVACVMIPVAKEPVNEPT